MSTNMFETTKRQLIICCDGTNNNLTGGSSDTNVVKLVQLIAESDHDSNRIVFYDPGVGNPGELPGATWTEGIKRWFDRVSGLALGQGVFQNMAECYLFLMRNYRPGDEIYIFGFSRGAFTARSIAGMVNLFGVLSPHMESMVSTLLYIYFSDRDDKAKEAELKKIAAQTSLLFTNPASRDVPIHFVGAWDTVASVGIWPFQQKMTAKPTIVGKKFMHVRQAIALDEHRTQFKPRLYTDDNGKYKSYFADKEVTIIQLWFRGAHCDVGGGYANGKTAISNRAMEWIISEAVCCGLSLSYNQTPLNSEPAVREAWKKHDPNPASPIVHSEQYKSHLWALTGLSTRQTDTVLLDDDAKFPISAIEHPSVGLSNLSFASGTEWSKRKSTPTLIVWLFLAVLLFFGIGGLLSGDNLSLKPSQIASFISHSIELNLLFSKWQLLWIFNGDLKLPNFVNDLSSPRSAVLADFMFIIAYSFVLSWFAVSAFAKKAGLRRANSRVQPWLNKLGMMLPLMICADILENIFTLFAITLLASNEVKASNLCGVLMSTACFVKWFSLIGVVILLMPIFKKNEHE